MKTEILSISTELPEIIALYGFGSFFRRGHSFNDIDVVAIAIDEKSLPSRYYALRTLLQPIADKYGVSFDITLFTPSEFAGQPLRDMDSLVPIW